MLMNRAHVDALVSWETTVVAEVKAGTMTQADRFDTAMRFFREVLASAYLMASAIELGCQTMGDVVNRFSEVRARAEHQLGFDPYAVLRSKPSSEAAEDFVPQEPLFSAEWIRNLVASVLGWTELETLLTEAHARDRAHEVLSLVGRLTSLLRRVDAFYGTRMRILAAKHAAGELSITQCAEMIGLDEQETLAQLAQPRRDDRRAAGYRPDPRDEEDVLAGLEEAAAGVGVALTPEELARWEATGELPASVEARFAECASPT